MPRGSDVEDDHPTPRLVVGVVIFHILDPLPRLGNGEGDLKGRTVLLIEAGILLSPKLVESFPPAPGDARDCHSQSTIP